jgi:hypothetical protein
MPTLEPKNIQEACRDPAYAMILEHLVEGASSEDLIADLEKAGQGNEEATRVVKHGKLLLKRARRDRMLGELFVGILILVIGGGITLFTILNAADTGGHVLFCYGAIIVGFIKILRAISYSGRSMRRWLRQEVAFATDGVRRPRQAPPPSGPREEPPPSGERRRSKKRTYDY